MQDIADGFRTAIRRGYSLPGQSITIAEWNYNNLFNTTVTNDPDDQGWILNKDTFPPSAVTSGFRPNSGIFFAVTDEAFTDGSVTGLDANRYYTVDPAGKFKYWVCPTPSNRNTAIADAGSDIGNLYPVARGTLIVDYGRFLNMNKVSVTLNLGPKPSDWSIWVFEQTANNWIEINNPVIDEITGKVELWWNGTAWVQTQQLNESIYQHISKIKVEVRALDQPNKRLQIVEIAGKREIDLTARTESYSINASMDNQDFIFPVGKMAANDGSIVFNNNDLKINHEDSSSDFYGLLEGWCQYRTYVVYDLTDWGGGEYIERTSTMYANDFQQNNEWQYTVELFDVLKILQSIDCPALLIENQSLARIIATLLDMVGVDTYFFDFTDWDVTNTVKYFWTDGTEKLFDVLSRLVESFQAALFVDEFGIIKLVTRTEYTPVDGEVPVWTLLGEKQGPDLPDIIKLSKKYSLQINKLNIKYTKRQAKIDDLDITEQPLTSTVWEASDTVVLRSAPLVRTLLAEDLSAIPYRAVDGLLEAWTDKNCTRTRSTDHASPINLSQVTYKMVPVGSPSIMSFESFQINVSSVGKMNAAFYIWPTATLGLSVSASVNWFDANRQFISKSENWVTATAGSWQKIENDFDVPPTAKYCSLEPTIINSVQTWYVDLTQLNPTGFVDNWDIWVSSADAAIWPYSGRVNIDGEIIEYSGKSYAWWDHSTSPPTYWEYMIYSDDERKALDRKSYQSWTNGTIVGGVSTEPTYQNHFVGRIRPKKRDWDDAGRKSIHACQQAPGWYTMDFWTQTPNSWAFPGKYFTPGGSNYNIDDLKNWDAKVNWTETQGRVSIANSVATIDNRTVNSSPDIGSHATILVKDHKDTEFREFGTRLRIRGGTRGRAIIPFYMTDAPAYDNVNPPITEVFDSNRCYVVNICTSEFCDSINRGLNEVSVDYKNGNDLIQCSTASQIGQGGNGGKMKIDADKWYDIDVIFRDGHGEVSEGGGVFGASAVIEIYVDGAYMDTWLPAWDADIRPTSLIGLGAKDASIVDFEYIYGTTTTSKGRFAYTDDSLFDAQTLQLPAGTGVTQNILLPIGTANDNWLGSGEISFATVGSAATISNLEIEQYWSTTNTIKLSGNSGLILQPEQRMTFDLDSILPDNGYIKITYTAANPISVCMEYSLARSFPYGIDNEPVPPPQAYYDRLKNGFVSQKSEEFTFDNPKYTGMQFLSHEVTTPIFLEYFYEDFGSFAHEIRDFAVDFDSAPAKGVSVYSSNDKVRVIDSKYNPMKGYFTMVNTSHRNEIVNGTEQIDESNSIDQVLTLYGYVLESKGDAVETVTNDISILRHGPIMQDLDAAWIFSQDEAKALGQWVTTHWAESMDTLTLETFCSSFLQIGDKVNIYYPNANIGSSWIFVVTDKSVTYDGAGLSTTLTVRRVR